MAGTSKKPSKRIRDDGGRTKSKSKTEIRDGDYRGHGPGQGDANDRPSQSSHKHRPKRRSIRSLSIMILAFFLAVSVLCNVWSVSRLSSMTQPAGDANEIPLVSNRRMPIDGAAKDIGNAPASVAVSLPGDAVQDAMQDQQPDDHLQAQGEQVQDPPKQSQLILHLGPAKTATTTLQIDMRQLAKTSILADEDKYLQWGISHYHGVFKNKDIDSVAQMWDKDCMLGEYARFVRKKQRIEDPVKRARAHAPACIRMTKLLFNKLKKTGMSLIISNELYSITELYERDAVYSDPIYFENLKDLTQGLNVTVVLTYRRFAEWILSSVKQFNMQAIRYEPKQCMKWPSKGGKPHNATWPTIQDWLAISRDSSRIYGQQMMVAYIWIYLDGIATKWRDAGFRVHIMNMHSERQITKQLMCDFIQDAPRACEYLNNRTEEPPRNVRSMSWFAYNDIAYTAAQRGVINAAMQAKRARPGMAGKLASYHGTDLNKTFADFPLKCPKQEELDQLLELSLALERKWMPEWYATPKGEAAHRASFQRIVNKKREYCTLDMERLFDGVRTMEQLYESLARDWD